MEEKIKGYKSFKKGMICKNKKYEENTTYEEFYKLVDGEFKESEE